jgi:hypothetical protein
MRLEWPESGRQATPIRHSGLGQPGGAVLRPADSLPRGLYAAFAISDFSDGWIDGASL